jgi:hypothetical protein
LRPATTCWYVSLAIAIEKVFDGGGDVEQRTEPAAEAGSAQRREQPDGGTRPWV